MGPQQTAPEHLNSTGCRIRYSEGKGRGVYASREIPAETVVEISPVLLFTREEYEEHGKYTMLDHYTFKWRDGRSALALGLGSLFNHSENPNVSFVLDPSSESIRYTTFRTVREGEELCIFYGHRLWFRPEGFVEKACVEEDMDDEWGGLALIENDVQEPFADGDPDEIIPEDDLPFTRVKITPTIEEEETPDAIRTLQAWVVDIPDPRKITTMLKWLKQSGFDSDLGHLKRIRRHGDTSTLLICTSATTPILPTDLGLAELYTVPIPSTAALTITSAKLKSAIWPTVYAPRRKGEIEPMTRGRVKWACDAMRYIASQAMSASAKGELPIVAHVPIPYDNPAYFPVPFTAHDTRNSTAHPLRHAVLNVIRSIADHRSSASESECPSEDNLLPASSSQNGSNYLLTSLSLFTTHEPCIMCSMALLHSRVKEVYFLVPKEKTGGCGSLACLPRLDGVNHRYGIWQWHDGRGDMRLYTDRLVISDSIDA